MVDLYLALYPNEDAPSTEILPGLCKLTQHDHARFLGRLDTFLLRGGTRRTRHQQWSMRSSRAIYRQ